MDERLQAHIDGAIAAVETAIEEGGAVEIYRATSYLEGLTAAVELFDLAPRSVTSTWRTLAAEATRRAELMDPSDSLGNTKMMLQRETLHATPVPEEVGYDGGAPLSTRSGPLGSIVTAAGTMVVISLSIFRGAVGLSWHWEPAQPDSPHVKALGDIRRPPLPALLLDGSTAKMITARQFSMHPRAVRGEALYQRGAQNRLAEAVVQLGDSELRVVL